LALNHKRGAILDVAESGRDSFFVATDLPTRRVILLGASNLRRSFATVVSVARRTWDEPVDVMAAMGHGRSYGQDSTVLGRKIPGIFPCALWQDLQRRSPLPTAALITDIGNDLLFGVPPEQLLQWITACLDRLSDIGATTIVTQLPIASLERLSEARFRLFRRVFFPRSTVTLSAALNLARTLNAELIAIGQSQKTPVIPVSESWYGLDSIHLKRRVWRHAWPTILASWRAANASIVVPRAALWTRAYLATLPPWERTYFGVRRCAAQPSGRLSDGTTISLY
jgi:hypothetical protein